MSRKTNEQIIKKNLIFCEGRDAENFLIAYLNSTALSDIPSFSNDFQVMDFGGNSNLSTFIANTMNMENFDTVESILIIRDAERDGKRAEQDIISALNQNGLSVPSTAYEWKGDLLKIGYVLFPTCDCSIQSGTLEDLCLSILSENCSGEILNDIQAFMNAVGAKYNRVYPHEFKSKLHTYFSITDKYVSLKVGEAASAGAFNWVSPQMLSLKNFLLKII